jgi:hypothetical protein
MLDRFKIAGTTVWLTTLALYATPTSAMEVTTIGSQLVLSGGVVDGDVAKVKDALAATAAVDTIVLRNSPGGDAPTGYRLGELFREKGFRTLVSGFCYSSCSRMFLGGKTRYFTDDYLAVLTHVGLHGHYGRDGRLASQVVSAHGLRDWIIRYSDGKADVGLVERWIAIPINVGMIHFYHPALYKLDGVSTFLCQGSEPMARSVVGCEPISRTALDLGIVTSLEIHGSNDQAAIRASIPPRPGATKFAAIEDASRVPLTSDAGLAAYRSFLSTALPRAFAIAADRKWWAWYSGSVESATQALARCVDRAHLACTLYAIDNDVVWPSAAH